jgi:hypothetical protein
VLIVGWSAVLVQLEGGKLECNIHSDERGVWFIHPYKSILIQATVTVELTL